MTSINTKRMMLAVYEKERLGEIDRKQRDNLLKLIQESTEFIQSNLDKLAQLHKDGKLSDEDYDKQVKAWKARELNYEDNLRKEKERKEQEDKKLASKSKSFISKAKQTVSSTLRGNGQKKPVYESEEYHSMKYELYERERLGIIDIDTRNRLIDKLDEMCESNK